MSKVLVIYYQLLLQVKNHMWIFVNALIENPTFDSQTKENMTLQVKSFGSTCQLSEKFIKAVSTQRKIKNRSTFLYFPLPFSPLYFSAEIKLPPTSSHSEKEIKKQLLPLTRSYQALNYHLYTIYIYPLHVTSLDHF